MRLCGKVALVTGAGRGIGRAIAQALAREGASVIVNDRDKTGANETVRGSEGCSIAAIADIGVMTSQQSLIELTYEEFGKLDILVNNAGIQFHDPFLDAQPETWDRTFDINLKAPFFLIQQAAKRMIQAGSAGTILNIASIHDSVALRNRSVYAITKGGLRMMTRSLALELAEYGITVNAISPGAILTDMNHEVLADPACRERVLRTIPLGRIGNPEDIAGAAVFLVSPEASYITGATPYVDGGILVQ
jgi:glucose 1-dehydrogenase